VTPFSFALEAGVYFPFIPPVNPLQVETEDGELLPQEVDCHIRRSAIGRGLKQWKNRIPNVWNVEPDGSNIEEIIEDVGARLTETQPWFEQFDDLSYVGELLARTQRTAFRGDLELNASGISCFTPGFLALEVGQWRSAADLLHKALDSGAFSSTEYMKSARSTAKTVAHAAYLESQMRAAIAKAHAEIAKEGAPTAP
jgi:hypothetical protein